jgi:flavorubredoxin
MKITNEIFYVGVNDHAIDLFEGQYKVPGGMAYNSYLIHDEKIAVMDSVEAHYGEEWLSNIQKVLGDRQPDYLIVQHMEPDHSANIVTFMENYPGAILVSSDKAFAMIKQFYHNEFSDRRVVIKDGDTLSLGKHVLTFVGAPMVHWPEVMVTYDAYDRVLFSADAFGKFGALDVDEPWEDEARRYYIGIVGKYGVQVQKLLARAKTLDIAMICPLHGPVLSEDLGKYISLYDVWSRYDVESEGIVIAYTSVYGNTKKAVQLLEQKLRNAGAAVTVHDLARCDKAVAVADAFRYGKLVLATTTYNADIFPFMREFIHELTERGYQNRTVGIIENGSWAPTAAKKIKAMLEGSKNLTILDPVVSLRSAMNEQSEEQLDALAAELVK